MNKITEAVATSIKECAPKVEERIINALVEREVNRRSEAVVRVMDQISRDNGKLLRFKPDLVTFNVDGTKATEAYSKEKLEERNKIVRAIDKASNAVSKALENGEYSDVYNLKS